MRISHLLTIGCTLLSASACVPYKPTLFLDPSPVTIPAKVQVRTLNDVSPQDDKEHATAHSFSQTSTDSLEENLDTLVTKAILADFSATSVFKSVANSEREPDLILSGTIYRFSGDVTLPSWTMIPGVAWAISAFWAPAQERHGIVDLEVTLARPNGEIVGRYRGCGQYAEVAGYDHHYWSMPVYPAHRRLNQLFTTAVQDIRDQILDDREVLVAAVRDPTRAIQARHASQSPPCVLRDPPEEPSVPGRSFSRTPHSH